MNNLLAFRFEDFLSSWYGVLIFVLVDIIIATTIIAVTYRFFFKQMIDFLCGFISSVATLPIVIVIAIVSKTHIMKGEYATILTKTPYIGKHGKTFYKLSFTIGVEENGNPNNSFSAFLRKSKLEKLPVVYNLLLLQYSIVGVTPLVEEDAVFMSEEDEKRFGARVGFINPLYAYVTDKKNITFEEMFRCDSQYAKKFSLWQDVKILIACAVKKMRGEGKNVLGDGEKQGQYGKILLENNQISQTDYDEAIASLQEEKAEREKEDNPFDEAE